MTRIEYTAHRRRKLDQQIGDPRQYDLFLRNRERSQLMLVRESLGISIIELAMRMKLTRNRIRQLEADERTGRIRLSSLENAAAAMGCQLIIGIVPRGSSFSALIDGESEAS